MALLKVAHDSIKAVNPDAVIMSPPPSPPPPRTVSNRNDILFLEDMYRGRRGPYFRYYLHHALRPGPAPR